MILSFIIVTVVVFIFVKVIFPLQKKLILESQKYLIEKAELMALFAEMDPDPLLRMNTSGNIIQTNEASRRIFPEIEHKEKKIWEILPSLKMNENMTDLEFLEKIEGKVYSVNVKMSSGQTFANVYLHDITKIKEYEFELEDNKSKLKLLADKLDTQYEELKKSLSSELHDDIGQRLILVKLRFASIDKFSAGEIQSELEMIYQRIREISKSLKPAELSDLGLELSIQTLVQNVSQSSGIRGSFDFYGDEDNVDHEIGTCIFRVIQESLNNIVKHSKAEEFSVQCNLSEDYIDVVVSDDGEGIPKEYFAAKGSKNFGIGLFGMKERLEKWNGMLKINSNPETGTELIIHLPKNKGV